VADLIGPLHQLRDAAVQALNVEAALPASTTIAAPARRIVALAPVTVDCEQLAVGFLRSYRGHVGVEMNDPRTCPPGRVMEVDLLVMRCYPVMDGNGQPPPADAITAATDVALADAMTLEGRVPGLMAWRKGDGVVGATSALRVQGGYAGIAVRVAFRVL
jgi:hypothetical protein